MKFVQSAVYKENYTLRLTFDDGVVKDVDFSPYLNQGLSFAPLKNKELFQNFSVDTTVVWPTGADIAPDTLYNVGTSVK